MASTPNSGIVLTKTLPTLSSIHLKVSDLLPKFGIKKRDIDADKFINKFLTINKDCFSFLDIKAEPYRNDDKDRGIIITTGRYSGAIPIKSPVSSQYTVDFRVKGSYCEDINDDQIFNLLGRLGLIQLPEFNSKFKLVSTYHRPPNYIENINFINLYLEAKRLHWTKFISIEKEESIARGYTDWSAHSLRIDPAKKLLFPNKINSQTILHKEWKQLNFVLKKCIEDLSAITTPSKIRINYAPKITMLKRGLDNNSIESVKEFKISGHDPFIIKELKKIGNMILRARANIDYAWRFDIAELYEKYIGYIFKHSSQGFGWVLKSNPHYPITGYKPNWALNYLEPDLVLSKSSSQIIIDAKYKSYLLSRRDTNEVIRRETFRHDLHQILAYTSFCNSEKKIAILVSPGYIEEHKDIENNEEIDKPITRLKSQSISSPFSAGDVKLYLLAIPFTYNNLDKIIAETKSYFRQYFIINSAFTEE